MKPANRYTKSSKISEAKFQELLRYFVADLPATQISKITRINLNKVNHYVNVFQEDMQTLCAEKSFQWQR